MRIRNDINSVNTYKGVSFPFRFNSRGGVAMSELTHSDFSRIRESIHQILFTHYMERVMNLDFGTDRGMLFYPTDDITELSIIQYKITEAIEKFEDRVEVNSCEVFADTENEGTVIVSLDLHIIKFVKDVQIVERYELPAVAGL